MKEGKCSYSARPRCKAKRLEAGVIPRRSKTLRGQSVHSRWFVFFTAREKEEPGMPLELL